MNDLNQLLHDASASQDDRRLDPQDLLSSGRRKVRKRRIAVAGGTTAAVLLAVAATGWLRSGDDRPDYVEDPDGRSAIYEEVRVPIDEVERRCSAVINAPRQTEIEYVTGVSDNRVAVPGAETDQPIDAAEGDIVLMFSRGDRWPPGQPDYDGPGWPGSQGGSRGIATAVWRCVVPQLDLMDGIREAGSEPALEGDPAVVLDQCSRFSGYDISGWKVLTTRTDVSEPSALLFALSDNGFVARCEVFGAMVMGTGEEIVGAKGKALVEILPVPVFASPDDVDPALRDDLFSYYCTLLPTIEPVSCSGTLPDPVDDHRVEVLFDGSSVGETTTEFGEFDLRTATTPGEETDVVVRLLSPDGEVLWSERIEFR